MSSSPDPSIPHTAQPNRLLRVGEVASLLGVPSGTVRWWVHVGRIPFVRFGPRTPRFKREEVESFIEQNSKPATPGACGR